MPVKIIGFGQMGDEIPCMDGPCQFIEAVPVDRQSRIVQLLDTLFQSGKGYIVGSTAYLRSCPHDLPDVDGPEFSDTLEDVPFFFPPFAPHRLIYLLLDDEPLLFLTEETLEPLRMVYRPGADPSKKEMYQLNDAGCIVGELQVVMCGPDLGHDLDEKDHDEGDDDHLDKEFEDPKSFFQQDHLIDEKIGQDDDGYVDDTIGDDHGSQ